MSEHSSKLDHAYKRRFSKKKFSKFDSSNLLVKQKESRQSLRLTISNYSSSKVPLQKQEAIQIPPSGKMATPNNEHHFIGGMHSNSSNRLLDDHNLKLLLAPSRQYSMQSGASPPRSPMRKHTIYVNNDTRNMSDNLLHFPEESKSTLFDQQLVSRGVTVQGGSNFEYRKIALQKIIGEDLVEDEGGPQPVGGLFDLAAERTFDETTPMGSNFATMRDQIRQSRLNESLPSALVTPYKSLLRAKEIKEEKDSKKEKEPQKRLTTYDRIFCSFLESRNRPMQDVNLNELSLAEVDFEVILREKKEKQAMEESLKEDIRKKILKEFTSRFVRKKTGVSTHKSDSKLLTVPQSGIITALSSKGMSQLKSFQSTLNSKRPESGAAGDQESTAPKIQLPTKPLTQEELEALEEKKQFFESLQRTRLRVKMMEEKKKEAMKRQYGDRNKKKPAEEGDEENGEEEEATHGAMDINLMKFNLEGKRMGKLVDAKGVEKDQVYFDLPQFPIVIYKKTSQELIQKAIDFVVEQMGQKKKFIMKSMQDQLQQMKSLKSKGGADSDYKIEMLKLKYTNKLKLLKLFEAKTTYMNELFCMFQEEKVINACLRRVIVYQFWIFIDQVLVPQAELRAGDTKKMQNQVLRTKMAFGLSSTEHFSKINKRCVEFYHLIYQKIYAFISKQSEQEAQEEKMRADIEASEAIIRRGYFKLHRNKLTLFIDLFLLLAAESIRFGIEHHVKNGASHLSNAVMYRLILQLQVNILGLTHLSTKGIYKGDHSLQGKQKKSRSLSERPNLDTLYQETLVQAKSLRAKFVTKTGGVGVDDNRNSQKMNQLGTENLMTMITLKTIVKPKVLALRDKVRLKNSQKDQVYQIKKKELMKEMKKIMDKKKGDDVQPTNQPSAIQFSTSLSSKPPLRPRKGIPKFSQLEESLLSQEKLFRMATELEHGPDQTEPIRVSSYKQNKFIMRTQSLHEMNNNVHKLDLSQVSENLSLMKTTSMAKFTDTLGAILDKKVEQLRPQTALPPKTSSPKVRISTTEPSPLKSATKPLESSQSEKGPLRKETKPPLTKLCQSKPPVVDRPTKVLRLQRSQSQVINIKHNKEDLAKMKKKIYEKRASGPNKIKTIILKNDPKDPTDAIEERKETIPILPSAILYREHLMDRDKIRQDRLEAIELRKKKMASQQNLNAILKNLHRKVNNSGSILNLQARMDKMHQAQQAKVPQLKLNTGGQKPQQGKSIEIKKTPKSSERLLSNLKKSMASGSKVFSISSKAKGGADQKQTTSMLSQTLPPGFGTIAIGQAGVLGMTFGNNGSKGGSGSLFTVSGPGAGASHQASVTRQSEANSPPKASGDPTPNPPKPTEKGNADLSSILKTKLATTIISPPKPPLVEKKKLVSLDWSKYRTDEDDASMLKKAKRIVDDMKQKKESMKRKRFFDVNSETEVVLNPPAKDENSGALKPQETFKHQIKDGSKLYKRIQITEEVLTMGGPDEDNESLAFPCNPVIMKKLKAQKKKQPDLKMESDKDVAAFRQPQFIDLHSTIKNKLVSRDQLEKEASDFQEQQALLKDDYELQMKLHEIEQRQLESRERDIENFKLKSRKLPSK